MDLGHNFSPKAQFFIKQSKQLASSFNDVVVKEDHLLLLILQSGDPMISAFLNTNNIDIHDYIDFVVTFSNLHSGKLTDSIPEYSDSFKTCLAEAIKYSNKLKHEYVGPEHLFFSLINTTKGSTYNFLQSIGGDPRKFIKSFIECNQMYDLTFNFIHPESPPQQKLNPFLGRPDGLMIPPPQPDPTGKSLENYCVNLNDLCDDGKINNVVGRDDEIERICEILARKHKNNPLLIGEPGVGKTACVEGLAYLIQSNQCPTFLSEKQIYAVDLASMVAGTKYRGQFEERLKNLIDEASDTNTILFLDEAHTVIGAGGAEGAMDAANILKPALARGSIKLIAATTYPEFKKTIEKDSALCRRFQQIFIEEPSVSDCKKIIHGIKKHYESFHQIKYPAKIINYTVDAAEVYLPDSFFPDKAIDIIDECGAKLNLKNSTKPQELIDAENDLYDISSDSNISEEQRLFDVYEALNTKWENEKQHKVTQDDINLIVSRKSKLPVENIFPNSFFNSKEFTKILGKDVIGQPSAIESISNSISRSKLGLKSNKKPIGSFLFLGSTGTGKTFCAKSLAKAYFGSERKLIRFDMSEFSEKVSASKLIGASPGYVGYEEGGQLVEKIRKNPHSILLLDEIEKSHRDVQQLLLQILEEGEVEDNAGRKAYFHNCIIILTSNIGAHLLEKSSLGFSISDSLSKDESIKKEALKILSPELFNRIDEVVVFNNLSKSDMKTIFKQKIKNLNKNLKPKKIVIDVSDDVCDFICEESKKSNLGARPLDRCIKKYIEDSICLEFSDKNIQAVNIFQFKLEGGEIKYEMAE
jgi:ATP-dependent Clp protease ATP-binding subunit ClpC